MEMEHRKNCLINIYKKKGYELINYKYRTESPKKYRYIYYDKIKCLNCGSTKEMNQNICIGYLLQNKNSNEWVCLECYQKKWGRYFKYLKMSGIFVSEYILEGLLRKNLDFKNAYRKKEKSTWEIYADLIYPCGCVIENIKLRNSIRDNVMLVTNNMCLNCFKLNVFKNYKFSIFSTTFHETKLYEFIANGFIHQISKIIMNHRPIWMKAPFSRSPLELDIYIELKNGLKLAIEYNDKDHNRKDRWKKFKYEITKDIYHESKTYLCLKQNVLLLHIWENSYIKNKEHIENFLIIILSIMSSNINIVYDIQTDNNCIATQIFSTFGPYDPDINH